MVGTILGVGKIALFCKFWFVSRLVRFVNVCNVRGLSQLPQRAKARRQNKIFLEQSFLNLV
jgi:hypothetical protein